MRSILAALLCVGQAVAGEPLPGLPESPRILFQGDSITDGNRGRGADLADLATAHGAMPLPPYILKEEHVDMLRDALKEL